MEDIAPELLKKIQEDFQADFDKSTLIKELYAKVRDGTATYKEANDFAIEAGNILAGVYKKNLSSDVLPDGKLYYNIAQRILNPTMENNYSLITDVTDQVQQSLNEAANIGIKPITPELNRSRIDGIINRVSSEDIFDDVAWLLEEPIKNFSQSIVDDSIRENAEFHTKAGMRPKIVRKLVGGCCEWCSKLAGTYTYPDVPEDVYRRHQRCRCTVDYNPGSGKIQNVHSKQWRSGEERDRLEMRKTIGLQDEKQQAARRIQKAKDLAEKITKRIDNSAGSSKIKLPDTVIHKGVGAKAKNYDVLDQSTGEVFHFAEGTRIQNSEVFAGKGTKKPLHDGVAEGLSEQIGGKPENWQHCKGTGVIDYYGEERTAEVHWFQEETVGKVKFKVKEWKDED